MAGTGLYGGFFEVSTGGIATGTTVNGGFLTVNSGGEATGTTVYPKSFVTLQAGATFSDSVLQAGAVVDFGGIAYAAGGTATVNSTTDVLTFNEGGVSTPIQLAGNYAGDTFSLSSDNAITTFGMGAPGTELFVVQAVGTPIPEPATLTLLAIAALFLSRLRAGRKSRVGRARRRLIAA